MISWIPADKDRSTDLSLIKLAEDSCGSNLIRDVTNKEEVAGVCRREVSIPTDDSLMFGVEWAEGV